MLYPDFNDLVSFKNVSNKMPISRSSVRSVISGNHHSPFKGQGLEFDSVREYVLGDDIRNIDWGVTARTGMPHIKLFKEEKERHRTICLDMNRSMRFGTKVTFKSVQAARIAAFLGWQGLKEHDSVNACLFGNIPDGLQFFSAKRTAKSFCPMLKMLTEPFPNQDLVSLNTALEHTCKTSRSGSLVYVISDFMDLDFENSLKKLHRRFQVVFIAVNDLADHTLSSVGLIGFAANDSNKFLANTDDSNGRAAYRKIWDENRQHLYTLTSKYKIPLIELTTQSDIRKSLMTTLKVIGKRKRK